MTGASPQLFLSLLRDLHPDLPRIGRNGSCFRVYLLLKAVWPEAEAWYDSNHVITKIGEQFWDIHGEVFPESHYRMADDAAVFNRAYTWGGTNIV